MSQTREFDKYDQVLSSILENEKSILGFLSAIFNFLARRTDFYIVTESEYQNMGFPPGVAEELVIKVLRSCDPKTWKPPNGTNKPADLHNEIMCSTVAQEVEVVSEDNTDVGNDSNTVNSEIINEEIEELKIMNKDTKDDLIPSQPEIQSSQSSYSPPVIPTQKNSETYNGAERDKYLWSQTILELDVIVKLPPSVKSSKDLKVTINNSDVSVLCHNGDVIINDSLPHKIKAMDSIWSISEGRLLLHLEKVKEHWWDKFLNSEVPIDLSKIDCSRPLNDLPEDHIAKVRELQWNQEQKLKGLPTSDEIRNLEILKKAWNAPGSPFQGQEFNPNILNQSNMAFNPPQKK